MSIPMKNIHQKDDVPSGAGYPPPQVNPPPSYNQGSHFGLKPSGAPGGYEPVPQYGEEPSSFAPTPSPNYPPPPQFSGGAQSYNGQQPPPQGFGQQSAYGGHQPGYGGYGPAPIVNQPTGPLPPPGYVPKEDNWMTIPAGNPNCPRGLEYLMTIDQLLVKQKVELLEAFSGFETNNKYSIKNSLGQKVYFAAEESDCCERNCCGPLRSFDMRIFDNFKNEVMHLNRPLACGTCCFPCCLQKMEVSAPPGNLIGSIEQEWAFCLPNFKIKNERDETILRIEGPFCTVALCADVEFQVVSLTGENVGKISKKWSGMTREMYTDADFFGITFPMDLDVRMKAVLLGATFLIDMMFFEKSK